jgi:chromosome segregation ATPase
MTAAMLIIGVLFGVALAVTLAVFGILSMDGRFADNAKAAAAQGLARLTGRRPRATVSAAGPNPESEARIRGLQEEIRVMQRLMEQGRSERTALGEEIERLRAERAAASTALGERDRTVAELEARVQAERTKCVQLHDSLAERSAELARSRREARDLQTELSVMQSGTGFIEAK